MIAAVDVGKKLTPKESKFVREYLVDLDVERAAIAAGFSKSLAASKAYQWVRNGKVKPHVFNAIRKRQANLIEKTEITQERVVAEYAKLGFLDPRKFYDDEGNLIPIHKLSADVAATLTGMDVQTIYTKDGDLMGDLKKIKFADKKAALDSVAKHLGMFIERHEISGSLTLEDKLRKIRGQDTNDEG